MVRGMARARDFYWEVLKRASIGSSFWRAERISGFLTGLAAALTAYFGWTAPGGIEVVISLIFFGVFGAVFTIFFGYCLLAALSNFRMSCIGV